MSVEELKVAIDQGDEREWCEAARQVIGVRNWEDGRPPPESFIGDGGKWRNRFRDQRKRALARRVMLTVIEDGYVNGAAMSEVLWIRWGGNEKSKESFLTH